MQEKMSYLEEYLKTRRAGWPYENQYRIISFGEHGYAARIGDEGAGLAWADTDNEDMYAVMHMNLRSEYAEYGIGTELLHILMDHLVQSGYRTIRYRIPVEYWAYQIYENLGFEIESRTDEYIDFIRRI